MNIYIEKPELAPIAEFVRYLAIFQRAFTSIGAATENGDKDATLLGGWVANALHNVPAMLWSCREDAWDTPERMAENMKGFLRRLHELQAPPQIIQEAQRITILESGHVELGLREDLLDVELPPTAQLKRFLDMLYDACIRMRVMTNYGNHPRRRFFMPWVEEKWTPWAKLERVWTEDADKKAEDNRNLASVLLQLPMAIIQWNSFDETAFYEKGKMWLGEDWAGYWSQFDSVKA